VDISGTFLYELGVTMKFLYIKNKGISLWNSVPNSGLEKFFHGTLTSVVNLHTHTRLTALFSGTTRVSWYQKGKTNLDFTEARDSE